MKPFTIVTIFTFAFFLFCSCEPSKKERLLSYQWTYSSSHTLSMTAKKDIPAGTMTVLHENIDQFDADHIEKEFGSLQIFFNLDLEETDVPYTVILEYDFDYEGEWEIDGNYLQLSGDECAYRFSKGYALDPNADYDEAHYVELLKTYADSHVVQPLINSQMEPHTAEILELSDEKLTMKYSGNLTVQTLTRLKKPIQKI
ncbi:MAG: hypothetical protein K6E52_03930 [Bacteroidaceae bacterium]|nr:hypothetical protein [Bacteroidaceae bacterium]